jgi:nucleoside-diphosphate-sugar epimerase
MVVHRLVSAALAGEPLEVHGNGNRTRCFCHVHDTACALVDLLERGGLRGEIDNVGPTESPTISAPAERVLALTGSSSSLTHVPYEQAYGHGVEEMYRRIPDLGKIHAAIGWEPAIGLDRILAEVVAEQRAAGVAKLT